MKRPLLPSLVAVFAAPQLPALDLATTPALSGERLSPNLAASVK